MAWRVLCSDITIGAFRFSGVDGVLVRRSIDCIADYARITLPSISKIVQGKRASANVLTTSSQFAEGDKVTINVGYDDSYLNYGTTGPTPVLPAGNKNGTGMVTIFQGFVSKLGLNMPLEIECEGYSRLLRLNVDATRKAHSTTASELLSIISDQIPEIKVVVADDLPLVGVGLNHVNGIEIIQAIKRFSERTLRVFFINPTTLWCGLTYTPYSQGREPFGLGEVSYRLGYNAPKRNGLRMRVPTERVQILFGGTLSTGQRVMAASDDKTAKQKQKAIFNHVQDLATMRAMANEKQYEVNYAGYEGGMTGFLQPYCEPGWVANMSDARYPALDGKYLVEGTEIAYGMGGGRIHVDIGPQLGFGSKK